MRFKDPISHLKSHLGKGELELMRTTALSLAGFSAALIILLVQTKGQPPYSAVALWSSIASLLIWLFGAQYVSVYLVHGERTYKYINIFLSAAISIFGYISLFVAVVAMVLQLSVSAGIVLAVLGFVLAVAVFVHSQSVARLCNESDA
ncbi:hypothetical protein [Frateuria soli]|uniref:hypothetical protein n=1 Tax=Frateuria soli TaxID=1542730 RepID=UPI001E58E960|nr:hypothetical protein [Frateuria soli]UGB39226.1 hypothetical protein LQ771_05105 [Frateuria soli]